MTGSKPFPFFLAAVLCFAGVGFSAFAENSNTVVSLAEAVDSALRFNLGLAVKRYARPQADEDLKIQKAAFDVNLEALADAGESRTASSSNDSGTVFRDQSLQAGVNKKFGTGAKVGLETALDRADSGSDAAEYDADVRLTASQPLLKGGGPTVNEAGLRLGEIAVIRADLALQGNVQDLLRDTELAYWRLGYAIDNEKVRELALASSEKLLAETKAREAAGLSLPVDVLQAEADVAAKREAIIGARQERENAQDLIRAFMGPFQKEPGGMITTNLFPAPLNALPSVEASFARACRDQPEYLMQQQSIRAGRINVATARRNRWPSLNLSGSAGLAGQDDSSGGAYDGVGSGDDYDWTVGLTLQAPWGLREGRAQLQKAALSLAAEELRLEQLTQDLLVAVRAACRGVTASAESMQAAEKTVALQTARFEQQQGRYRAGVATLRDTLDAQTDLEDARLRALKAAFDQISSVVRLGRIEGSLLERHGLTWKTVETMQ
jgi:outer membrane protein TolC